MQAGKEMINVVLFEFTNYEKVNASAGLKIANKFYKNLPKDDVDFLTAVEDFIYSDKMSLFSVGTQWLKKRKSIFDMKFTDIYEKWVYEAIHGWGQCDQFCYRLTNPLLAKDSSLYNYVLKWSDTDDFNVKRIALVTLIGSSGTVAVDIDKVFYLTEKLKSDPDILIQKAVGWVLKVCYKEYPDELEKYLRKNVKTLSRTTFRYALEKVPKDLREELIKL